MKPRTVLFLGNFFFSMFAALTAYITLPYLSELMPAAYSGLAISAGALIALVLFPLQPKLVNRFGAQELALFFASAEMVSLFALAASPSAIPAAVLVALTFCLQPFLYYEFDLLIEATVAAESTTGRVRALFLTAWNVGGLAAPILMGALLSGADHYSRVFLLAGAVFVPFVVMLAARHLPQGESRKLARMRDTLACMFGDRDIAAVTIGHVILYLFYIWAPLYVPAYLHGVIGIPWSTLGWMFSVMLLPYALLQYPAGWLADKYLGDKEMMYAGFLIAGGALAFFSIVTPATPLWAILAALVVSRVGSALTEAMTEGHFFRRVSEKDVNSISIFRGVWPFADVIAPVVGSALLIFGDYRLLFVATGAFMAVSGVIATAFIRDFEPRRKSEGAHTAPVDPLPSLQIAESEALVASALSVPGAKVAAD